MNSKTIFFYGLVCLLSISSYGLSAQNGPRKFGKISKADFNLPESELVQGAHAVRQFDYGFLDYRVMDGFTTNLTRHFRTMILDEQGLDWADIEISYYKNYNARERIGSLKAFVYNLENGQITKTKLEGKDVFDEKVDKNNLKKKFALPNVKPGSIVEVKYEVSSEFWYAIDPWIFQRSIPVLHSELEMRIPEYFIFNTNFKGYEFGNLTVNDKSTTARKLFLGGGQGVDCQYNDYHWVAENIPPFTAEAYITTAKNYLGRVEFELARTNFPNSFNESYSTSWGAIAQQLAESEDFGATVTRANFMENQAAQLVGDAANNSEKVVKLYEGVKKIVKWNKKYRRFASVADVKKAINEGLGNSAQVNFALTCLLKAAGLEAYPVLVSTRSHGYINQFLPSFDQFNHVVSAVKVEDGHVILDATDPLIPANFMPQQCLNDKGFMLVGDKFAWVSLKPRDKYKLAVQAKFQITEDGLIKGNIKEARSGYAGHRFRQSFYSEGGAEDYIEEYQNKVEGLTVNGHEFKNQDNIYKRAEASYDIELSDKVIATGDMIYFSPMLHYAVEENPFKLTERKYPVDFAHPYEEVYVMGFELPDGFAVEELPEVQNIMLPEKAGKFTYTVKQLENTIQLTVRFKIDNPFFNFEQYPYLKEFYNHIVEKHAEQVVLKRKT
ncbi:MAG: DUF3857 domain-containing protein [Saprospiraceae bacterium]|nr:DUF3857 domain-containing protein [Saprospiraceae bacterium]